MLDALITAVNSCPFHHNPKNDRPVLAALLDKATEAQKASIDCPSVQIQKAKQNSGLCVSSHDWAGPLMLSLGHHPQVTIVLRLDTGEGAPQHGRQMRGLRFLMWKSAQLIKCIHYQTSAGNGC